jgi:putative DNA-invertase from lambdoid prophage Rac
VSQVNAGLARAKAQGKALGRPSGMTLGKTSEARTMLLQGVGVLKVAKTLGLGTGTIQKTKGEMRAAA